MATFRGKYDCLPGDCNTISTYLAGAVNGNGNGLIDGCSSGSATCESTTDEQMNIFPQLSLAGLVKGSFTNVAVTSVNGNAVGHNYPAAKLRDSLGIGAFGYGKQFPGTFFNEWYFANSGYYCPPQTTPFLSLGYTFQSIGCSGLGSYHGDSVSSSVDTLSPSEAYRIDAKIDDGLPGTGRVQGSSANSYLYNNSSYDTGNDLGYISDACINGNAYYTSDIPNLCSLDIQWTLSDPVPKNTY